MNNFGILEDRIVQLLNKLKENHLLINKLYSENSKFEEESNSLKTEISKLGLKTYPSYANFLLVEFPVDATNIYEELLKHGVIVRPLKNYNLLNCLRVTIGIREENEKFLVALKKVLGSIK